MKRHLVLAALSFVLASPATAQTASDFPSRPIRILVTQAAGSGVDLQARAIAQKFAEILGQPGVVENRAGANGILGMVDGAKAPPDGYTLVYAPVSALSMNQFTYKKLPYDALRDFTPISQTVSNPLGAVVNPASGLKSIKDVVDRAKSSPGQLNYGSFGIGNMTHLMAELLSNVAEIKMTHVPYRGQTPAMTDLISGQIPLAFTTLAGATELVKAGKMNLIATFGDQRDPGVPDVPTMRELGYPRVVMVGWAGILAPAGLPAPVRNRLHDAINKALAMPDVKALIERGGAWAVGSKSPEAFESYIKSEAEKFHAVIKAAGLEGSQ